MWSKWNPQFALFWMSILLHSAAVSTKLHLWHLQKKCHLQGARTPSTCWKRWKNNRTTARHSLLPWKYIQPCSREKLSVHFESLLTVTLAWVTHCRILALLEKIKNNKNTTAVYFIPMGDLKWWYALNSMSPCAPTCSYKDETLY